WCAPPKNRGTASWSPPTRDCASGFGTPARTYAAPGWYRAVDPCGDVTRAAAGADLRRRPTRAAPLAPARLTGRAPHPVASTIAAMANLTAVLPRPGEIVLEERPEPRPGPRDVVVAVEAVGVCGSDVHYYRHGRIGSFVVTGPLVLGHEAAGTVVAAGAEAAHPVGTRVAIEPGVPCRRCGQCRAGRYHLCRDIQFLATPPVDGAFTRLLAVPDDFAHPLPEQLDAEQGALLEPLSVGIWACRRADLRPGDRVLISGAGPVGLLAAEAARALGAGSVTVTEVSPSRLAVARRRRLDAVVDAAGGLDLAPEFDVL